MFDYVIIGAGSAGCIMANRLSADGTKKVVLIEAGSKDSNLKIKIPAAFFRLFESKYDWGYYSVPQESLNGRKLFMPRGKVWGGSSSINAMIYIRGHRKDYDEWARMGCKGWSYEEVLPYFLKSKNNQRYANAYHGQAGELYVSEPINLHPLSKVFIEACETQGVKKTEDFNGEEQLGVGYFQTTTRNGKRWSAADAFLKPALNRKNLKVISEAYVTKIHFSNEKAIKIDYIQEKATYSLEIGNKLILCGGAINTPQLLLLSGIGPGKELQEMEIPVIKDLPVGKNLQDHPVVPFIFSCNQDVTLDTQETMMNLLKYFMYKKGPFTSNIAEAGGFLKSNPELNAPDLQWHFGPAFFVDHGRTRPKGNGFSAAPILVKPKSRGSIKLKSPNPMDYPLIDQNFFSEPDDMKALIVGCKKTMDVLLSEPFAPYRKKWYLPDRLLNTDEEIEYHIRQTVEALYHPVSTCKMGIDNTCVTNPDLSLKGFENVFIVDASVMPSIIRGNTNAPTYMIAEKGANMILNAL